MKTTCAWCDEPIDASEAAPRFHDNPVHRECGIRLIAGSVGHQEKRCVCFGGDMEDPPNMTKRQAARAAALVFEMTGGRPDFAKLDEVGTVVAKIALRFQFEGNFFVGDMAVVGPEGSPDDVVLKDPFRIGSISARCVVESDDLRQKFMALVEEAVEVTSRGAGLPDGMMVRTATAKRKR